MHPLARSVALAASMALASPALAQDRRSPAENRESGSSQDADPERERLVRRVFAPTQEALQEALELWERSEAVPQEARRLWESSPADDLRAVEKLLDQTIEVLGVSSAHDVRAEVRRFEREIDATARHLETLREEQASAPPEAEAHFWQTSQEDYAGKIALGAEHLERLRTSRRGCVTRFRKALGRVGVVVGGDAAASLLGSLGGDRFVDLCVVVHNVGLVAEELQRLCDAAGEASPNARRYYGLYVLLVMLVDRVQDAYVRHVETKALPKLCELLGEASSARAEASRLLRTSHNAADRASLTANVEAGDLTLRAGANCAAYLESQATAVRARNRDVERTLRVAYNTYRTAQAGAGMARAIRSSRQGLDAVLSLVLPELRGFENAELRAEYERLRSAVESSP